ncbi:hypothetical protein [Goodfellowiella coeruleoviolacea]|uniref:Uncharacterized protein n=1 Tax=Goodfellowiella coeruleoviolacea TaxID=334858 RepID=A0AAE3GK84_9PSEU|nr:hypothetical protein [Goodfellowiella coeruleoviolacea]MCP2169771.1 hypothetical protein [Goodfellowiella coeruleoviolacea]
MTSTLTYGHSSFAFPRVHGWLPDKPGFYRALCGIRLADSLVTTYARPTREGASWCGACYLLTEHAADDQPKYVMRRSAVDGGNHIVPVADINQDRAFHALCGHCLSVGVAKAIPAWPCQHCLDTVTALLAQEVTST